MATIEQAQWESPVPHTDREKLLRDGTALIDYLRTRLTPPPFATLGEATTLASGENASDDAREPEPLGFPGAPRPARHAAVLAMIYTVEGEPWLLFTKRATGLPRHSGEICFPGGRREDSDPTLAHTALRETYEELALDTARVIMLGALPAVYASISNFAVTTYIAFLGEGRPDLTPAQGEVAEVIEAPMLALDDPAIYHQEIWTRGGISHPVEFYDYGRHRIWGLTGHLLKDLLGLLPPRAEE